MDMLHGQFVSKIVVLSIIPSGLAAMYGSSTRTTIPDLLTFRPVTLSNQARATGSHFCPWRVATQF